MTYLTGLTWGLFPYICLVVMIVGTIYRYQTDQLRWTSKSSELLEKKLLIIGSVPFHIGILLVFVGHILGLLVPEELYNALGISSELYHGVAIAIGGLSGLVALVGLSILLYRRIAVECVRMDTDISDYISDGVLWIVILLGLAFTLGYNLVNGSYEYRATVGPWVRSLFILHPDVTLMAGAPLVLQLHTALAFLLFGISPFTRLIHIYSFPIAYLIRAPLVYRARYGFARESVTISQRTAHQGVATRISFPDESKSASEPVAPESMSEFEHALLRIAHPLRWLWQRPHVTARHRTPLIERYP